MSMESFLTIYKKFGSKYPKIGQETMDEIRANYKKHYNDWGGFAESEIQLPSMYNFYAYTTVNKELLDSYVGLKQLYKEHLYVDNDGQLYLKICEYHFCSEFQCLKDYWYLSYNNDNNTHWINNLEIYKLHNAANYLLNGEYSKKNEKLMNNEFIQILGSEYSCYFNPKCPSIGEELLSEQNKLKTILTATSFILMAETWNDEEFKLEYSISG